MSSSLSSCWMFNSSYHLSNCNHSVYLKKCFYIDSLVFCELFYEFLPFKFYLLSPGATYHYASICIDMDLYEWSLIHVSHSCLQNSYTMLCSFLPLLSSFSCLWPRSTVSSFSLPLCCFQSRHGCAHELPSLSSHLFPECPQPSQRTISAGLKPALWYEFFTLEMMA